MNFLRNRKNQIALALTLVALGGGTSFYVMAGKKPQQSGGAAAEKPQGLNNVAGPNEQSLPQTFEPLPLAESEGPEANIWTAEQSQKLAEVLDLERKVFLEPEEEKELERYIETELVSVSVLLKSPQKAADLQQAQEDLVELMIADMEKNGDVRLALTLVNEAELSGSGSEPELHLAGLVGELLFHAFAYDPQVAQSWASQNDNPIKTKIFENTQRLAERNLQESQSEL